MTEYHSDVDEGVQTDALGTASDEVSGTEKVLGPAVLVLTVVLFVATAGLMLAATTRGLDLTDEGLYLLTAHRPHEYLSSVTKAHLVWSPVLTLFGSVAALRITNLVILLGAGVLLGDAVGREIECRQSKGRVSSATMILVVSVASVAPRSWLPQSPGYNDLALIAALGVAALVVRAMKPPTARSAIASSIALPVLLWVLLLAKWTSALVVVLLVLFPAARLVKQLPSTLRRRTLLCGLLVSIACVALTHVLLEPVPDIVRGLVGGVTDTSGSHSVSALMDGYKSDITGFLRGLGDYWWLLCVSALIGVLVARLKRTGLGSGLFVTSILLAIVLLATRGTFDGGPPQARSFGQFVPLILLAILVVWGAALVADKQTRSSVTLAEWAYLFILILLPFAIAVGTNNPIWNNAGIGSAIWLAALILISARFWKETWPVMCVALPVSAAIAIAALSGTWLHPYRQVPLLEMDSKLTSGPASGLTVDKPTANLIRAIAERVEPDSSLIVLWKMPGLVFAVDAVQPVHGWIPDNEMGRAVDAISQACGRNPSVGVLHGVDVLPDQIHEVLEGPSCSSRQFQSRTVHVPDVGTMTLVEADAVGR